MDHMTTNEIKLLEDFFEDLGQRMGNAGCNDFELPNTPENRALVTEAQRHCSSEEDFKDWQDNEKWKGKKIITYDFMILSYLADKALSILRTT